MMMLKGAAAALIACSTAAMAGKPHIVFIMVDDWGHGNWGIHAGDGTHQSTTQEEVVTPNLDTLVRQGRELEQFYTYSWCGPSRAALQSGRLPVHVTTSNDEPLSYNPADPESGYFGIPRSMTGVAEKLRSAGYSTHMTGKWDCGFATWRHTPMGRGYETFLGFFHHSNDIWTEKLGFKSTMTPDICGNAFTDLWNTTGPAKGLNGTAYEEDIFTENSLGIIDRHSPDKPLFLFHSFRSVHCPLQPTPEYEAKFAFIGDPDRRKYAAMNAKMDNAVGQIVRKLRSKRMWENTLLVVASDNGGPIYPTPFGGANNMGKVRIKGGKWSDWQGGIRVNALISGGFIPPAVRGTPVNAYMHMCDWYTTFAALAGVDAFDHRAEKAGLPPVDGLDMWPVLAGDASEPGPRDEIHISSNCLIQGGWKLLVGGNQDLFPKLPRNSSFVPFAGYFPGYGMASVLGSLKFQYCGPPLYCLYNIKEDPSEEHNVALHYKTLVGEMVVRLEELNKSIFSPDRGQQTKLACKAGHERWGDFYGPWILDIDENSPPPPSSSSSSSSIKVEQV